MHTWNAANNPSLYRKIAHNYSKLSRWTGSGSTYTKLTKLEMLLSLWCGLLSTASKRFSQNIRAFWKWVNSILVCTRNTELLENDLSLPTQVVCRVTVKKITFCHLKSSVWSLNYIHVFSEVTCHSWSHNILFVRWICDYKTVNESTSLCGSIWNTDIHKNNLQILMWTHIIFTLAGFV